MARKPGRLLTTSCWAVLLGLLSACSDAEPKTASGELALVPRILKAAPSTEVATWQMVIPKLAPEGHLLQALTFDEARGVLVLLGGAATLQNIWEWSPSTGVWTLRPATGPIPAERSGAAMVFDSVRNKVILFGGRATSGYDYEDLWEWDPKSGTWNECTATGNRPTARTQHAMLFQKSTGKILLFGGGRSRITSDRVEISASLGETWELDPASGTWTALTPAASPSGRLDSGLVWDSTRNKAVLFGGLQIETPDADGVAKQDTWEWDPVAQTWTERTITGNKPLPRFGHAMAYDSTRGKVVIFGGAEFPYASSIAKMGLKNDMWDWDPTTSAWTQTLTGSETDIPGMRMYAFMIDDAARARFNLVAGVSSQDTRGIEIWELDRATGKFSDRTVPYSKPVSGVQPPLAYDPTTAKVYYGSPKGVWAWDGSKLTQTITTPEESFTSHYGAWLIYDPVRQSLFTGNWELNVTARKWSRLTTTGLDAKDRKGPGVVTDTARKKILLFGGSRNAIDNEIWEWDGATLTWSRRGAVNPEKGPAGREAPVVSFDDARGKLLLFEGISPGSTDGESTSAYWEWDAFTGGWTRHDLGETFPRAHHAFAVYDSIRRRHVLFTDATLNGRLQVWELDAHNQTWSTRAPEVAPDIDHGEGMVFDSARGVVVLSTGLAYGGYADLWEYTVKNLANGQGCTAATASTCASGNCVDGVCCESASCTGACVACNVRGSEGKCVLAQAGTQVPGSCSDGQACDSAGVCKSKNGQACTAASACASGFCVDGVCCDGACAGPCKACNLTGRVGTCTPETAGSDPNGECGQGTGVCKSVCDGVGACEFPAGKSCGACLICDSVGACTRSDPSCGGAGGSSGKSSLGTGSVSGSGGVGGSIGSTGGAGGRSDPIVGESGGNGGADPLSSGGIVGGKGGNGGADPLSSGGIVAGGGGSGGKKGSHTSSTSLGGHSGTDSSTEEGSPQQKDAGMADARVVEKLRSQGCNCELGKPLSRDTSLLWTLLGASLLAWRGRRRR